MKKVFVSTLAMLFFMSLLASPVFAGKKQRYRWQGAAIGVGAAVLGHAVYKSYRNDHRPERVTVIEREHYRPACPPRHYRGHCEVEKVWVAPSCERVWNPGHYSRHGHWAPGEWITIETEPGYWTEERVRVVRR